MKFELEELGLEDKAIQTRDEVNDEIGKRATTFARYAMADVEYAMAVLGTAMSKSEYERVFRAMMVRKAKNEVRKHNAE